MIMKSTFYLVLLLLSFLSCQGQATKETNSENNSCNFAGNFVNKTALDRAQGGYGSELDKTNYYALEISFRTKDKIDIDNGFEKFSLPYTGTEEDCNYKIIGATQLGDMSFEAINDSVVILMDTAWTKLESPSTFKRFRNEDQKSWDYSDYLNGAVIAGRYTFTSSEGKPKQAHFLANGQVTGLKPYLFYELCYAGDCMEETETPANTILFTDDTGGKKLFVIKKPHSDEIQFYSVEEPKPDIKGERITGEMAFLIQKVSE